MYDLTDKEGHTSHISERTRSSLASAGRQSFVPHHVFKEKLPDVEDTVISRKRKQTSSRKPLKIVPKKEEVKKNVKKTNNRSARSQKERKLTQSPHIQETVPNEAQAPSNWAEVYGTMKEMRTSGISKNAAVDTMGCERIANHSASPRDKRYHILTSLMLSSQTKDTINAAAMNRLYDELPAHKEGEKAGLTLENILAVDARVLNNLIWGVGFHNNKTKYIKAVAEILRDRWDSDIPNTFDGLVSLPGVGPKMAYLCLSAAWGRTEGIGVDVHVHRITNLWGWHKTKTPEETRLALQAWLPKHLWHEINWLLVGFGQTTCLPVGKKCGECDLGMRGLCKAADKNKVSQSRKTAKLKTESLDESHLIESLKAKVENVSTGETVFSPKLEDELFLNLKVEYCEPQMSNFPGRQVNTDEG